MIRSVNVGHKSLADYHSIVSRDLMAEIRALAGPLEGKRVLHVNATSFGGGVAEILYSLVPLMNDAGLKADWKVMFGRDEFFHVTKQMHNALQGDPRPLSDADKAVFERYNLMNVGGLLGRVRLRRHPRPPAGRLPAARGRERRQVDLALPHRPVDAQPGGARLPAAAARALRPLGLPHGRLHPAGRPAARPVVMPPAIDPLAPKNMSLSPEDAAYIVDQFGLDIERPLILQVSRFDPWKDPLGVIDAYRIVKERFPDLQLALVGSMATDDPEGWEFFQSTMDYAGDDPDIYILSNLNNVGAVEVNAFQTQADVVVQKSIKEGFGLTVTEALWKARPTVAANVGGIPLQIVDGETGFLVNSPEETAQRCIQFLEDREGARAMARRGKQTSATTSSPRACCATGSGSSRGSRGTDVWPLRRR